MKKLFIVLMMLISYLTVAESFNARFWLNKEESADWQFSIEDGKMSAIQTAFSKPTPDAENYLNVVFVQDLVETEPGIWKGGTITDLRSSSKYDCQVTIKGNDIYVRGYVLSYIFGKTFKGTILK